MLRDQCKLCRWYKQADSKSRFPYEQVDRCYNSNWKPTGFYSKNDGPNIKCTSFSPNLMVQKVAAAGK